MKEERERRELRREIKFFFGLLPCIISFDLSFLRSSNCLLVCFVFSFFLVLRPTNTQNQTNKIELFMLL